jgi:tetratricopeptide (TPR) repeat protein
MIHRTKSESVPSQHAWAGPLAVFAVALILRLLHIYEIQRNPFFYHPIVDAWSYHDDALRMLQTGDWIGDRAFFQAPLTSYFLAIIYRIAGTNLLWPRLVQVLMGSLAAAGVFLLARRLFSERAAWIAGIIAACYPLFIFFEGELLAPAITLFLDVLFFLVLFRVARPDTKWAWLIPGLIFGLRALATTNNLATIPVFWVYIVILARSWQWPARRALLPGAIFTLGVAVAIVPVTVRNVKLHREFVLVSSNAGLNFYLGNTGDYEAKIGIRPGLGWDEFTSEHVRAGRRVGPEMSGYFFAESRKYIVTNPGAYLRLLMYKTYLFIRGDEIMRNQEIYPFRKYSGVLRALLWKAEAGAGAGIAFPFGVLLPLAWPGCLLTLRRRHRNGLLLLAYAAAYSLSVIAFFITARYRLPVVLPLTLILAYGWSELRSWWRPAGMRAAAVSGIVALFLISNYSPGRMPADMNADAYYSLASTHAHEGDQDAAEKYYRKALEMDPENAAAWVNLGLEVYLEKGMLYEAETCYRRALELRPDYATAVFNLGYLAQLGNRPAEAESLYHEAARLDPLLPGPHLNLASMALSGKEYLRAHDFYRQAYVRDPEDPRALVGLGVTAYELRGMSEALVYFHRAIRLDPTAPDTYFNLSLVYARSGRHGEAADNARRVVELDPTDNQAYMIYATEMSAAGRPEEAREFLESAARLYPDLPGPRGALSALSR